MPVFPVDITQAFFEISNFFDMISKIWITFRLPGQDVKTVRFSVFFVSIIAVGLLLNVFFRHVHFSSVDFYDDVDDIDEIDDD